jgi:hypothetical protein
MTRAPAPDDGRPRPVSWLAAPTPAGSPRPRVPAAGSGRGRVYRIEDARRRAEARRATAEVRALVAEVREDWLAATLAMARTRGAAGVDTIAWFGETP